MEMSLNGLIQLTVLEGITLRPYFDSVGVITIGVGATVTEIPNLAQWDKTKYITMQQAIDLLKTSIAPYERTVYNHLIVDVTQEQFDALVSLCYNIGQYGFSYSSLVRAINSKADSYTISLCFMMWLKPKSLLRRRTAEKDLFVTGKYTMGDMALLTDTDGAGHELKGGKLVNVRELLMG